MTTKKLGRQTVALAHPPSVAGHANVVGKKEGEGPLADSFDQINQDDSFGEKTWEKAETAMQKLALSSALDKAGLSASALDYILAGDLLNQCIGSGFAVRGQDVPFFGLYGACSTMAESLSLAALLLDGVSGGLAGAIGLALADILAGDPGYAVTTFILKFIIGITCGAVAHKVFKLRELDKHTPGYLAKVIVAAASGLLLNVFTDPFLGYFRNVYIFGQEYTIAKALTKITGGVTFVNSVASTVCVVILYLALRPALERANLLPKAQKASEPKAEK